MINLKKNITGTKMLMIISMVNTFILSGKLRIRGDFPLQQLLEDNTKEGGDLQKLIIEIIKVAGATGSCGIDFDFSAQDIQELLQENSFSIKELSEGSIEIKFAGKLSSQKKTEELSMGIKVSLTDYVIYV